MPAGPRELFIPSIVREATEAGVRESCAMVEMRNATVTMPIERQDDDRTCPACGGDAAVHQPELGLPDNLLLTCDACGAWTLLFCLPEAGGFVGVALPKGAAVLQLAC
jgi:rRNA maturation protein Nop10